MVDESLDELKKLSPKARLKRLKEIESKTKNMASQIEDLIKSSEEELKTDSVAEQIAPKISEISIDELFIGSEAPLEGAVIDESTEPIETGYVKLAQSDYMPYQKEIAYSSFTGIEEPDVAMIDQLGERLNRVYRTSADSVAAVTSTQIVEKIKRFYGLDR